MKLDSITQPCACIYLAVLVAVHAAQRQQRETCRTFWALRIWCFSAGMRLYSMPSNTAPTACFMAAATCHQEGADVGTAMGAL